MPLEKGLGHGVGVAFPSGGVPKEAKVSEDGGGTKERAGCTFHKVRCAIRICQGWRWQWLSFGRRGLYL